VRLTVARPGIVDCDPPALRVSFPPPTTTSTADITDTFCTRTSPLDDRLPTGRSASTRRTSVLEPDDAYELGRIATAAARTWCDTPRARA